MSAQWGLPLLAKIFTKEKFDQVHTAANDPYFEPPDPGILPTLNGTTGEVMKIIPLLRMYRLSRRKMRAFWAEGIKIQVISNNSELYEEIS